MGSPHFCSAFSQLYSFGSNGSDGINNEVQMPNLDISMRQVDSVVNVNGSGFSMNSKVMREDFVDPLRDGISPFPYQSHINYHQSGFRTTIHDIIPHQQLMSLMVSRKRSIAQSQMDFDSPPPYCSSKMIGYYDFKEKEDQPLTQVSKKLKKSSGKLIHHHEVNYDMSTWSKESKVQVKRSQKLGDKITALQKLVSPYGKTDTASVLQEACLSIKLLQEQIKNLFQMLSSSYHSVTALHLQEMVNGEEQEDLRSKGLCLVPMSFTNQVTMEEFFNSHHASSRKSHSNLPISKQYSAIFP